MAFNINNLKLLEPGSVEEIDLSLEQGASFWDVVATATEAYVALKPEGQLIIKSVDFSADENERPGSQLDMFERAYSELYEKNLNSITAMRALKIAGFLEIYSFKLEKKIVGVKTGSLRKSALPKVTVAIPAYSGKFFERSLSSAVAQDYPNIEVLVADEGADPSIEKVVKQYIEKKDLHPIVYFKHSTTLGERENMNFCRRQATGKYLKFLHDDDVLYPHCVSTLVRFFEAFEDSVSLVTAKRDLVNAGDKILVGGMQFRPLFRQVSYVLGTDMIEVCMTNTGNFVGEPSSYLLRLSDLDHDLPLLNVEDATCSFDLIIFIKQLLNRNLIYIPFPCSAYRIHLEQSSRSVETQLHCAKQWIEMVRVCREYYDLLQDDEEYYTALSNLLIMAGPIFNKKQTLITEGEIAEISWLVKELAKFNHLNGVSFKTPKKFFAVL